MKILTLDVVRVITTIIERTNLLALNATSSAGIIEAQRSAEDLARLSKGVRSIVGRFRL